MKLQLAMDDIALDDALKVLDEIHPYIDIIEVGTPMVIEYGMDAVRKIRSRFPEKEILADLKIMDGGYYEAMEAFNAGSDYITVLGVTDLVTIEGCVKAADETGKTCAVDMICVNDLGKRTKEVEDTGAGLIAVHTGVDLQAKGRTPLMDLKDIQKAADKAKVSVAGGINASTIKEYAAENPDIVVVGGGILHQENPAKAAKEIYDAIH